MLVARPLIGFPRPGRPVFPLRLRFSCGKLSEAGCPRLIKFVREMSRAPSSVLCAVLWRTQTILFFHCALANLIWSCVRDWLLVSWAPGSFSELRSLANNLSGVSTRIFWVGLGAFCWSLWTTRNKFTIEHVFPAKHVDCLFKSCAFLQEWKSLTKVDDQYALSMLISKVRASASQLCRQERDV